MGNTTSADIQGALPGSEPASPTPIGAGAPKTAAGAAGTPRTPAATGTAATAAGAAAAGVKLYRYLQTGKGGSWELVSSSAVPRFYDAHEDAAARYAEDGGGEEEDDDDDGDEHEGRRGRFGGGGASARKKATRAAASSAAARADWYLEVDGGGADGAVDARADDRLQYVADAAAKRVTFAAGANLSSLAQQAGVGGNGNGNGKSKPAKPKTVLVPPLFERDLKARSRLAKSSYDYLFAKPALRWLLGDYFENGLNSVLFFAPPLDPRVSVKAKLGNSAAALGGGGGGGGGIVGGNGGYGSMAIRYQPLGPNEPSNFIDVKANPRVAGDVAVRACFFSPDTGLGVFAALPLSPGATGRRPELGVRYSSPTLAAGSVVRPSTGEVSGVWLAGRLGDITAGVQVRPYLGPSAAFSRSLLDEPGKGRAAAASCSAASSSSSSPFPSLSSSATEVGRWLRERSSVAVAYTPLGGGAAAGAGGGAAPEARTRAGQPTFSAALEVVEGRAFAISFFQRMAAVRRVFNPFEGSDVVGITNYVDVGLRLVMPLLDETAGAGAAGAKAAAAAAAADPPSPSSGAAGLQLGAAWQANKNVYVKARLGSDGVAAMAAFKSWYQPSVAVAASAEWRFGVGGGPRYGLVAQVENFGALRYERSREASAAAHGATLTQRHEATPAELALAARERPLVPGDEALGARNVEPASQLYM